MKWVKHRKWTWKCDVLYWLYYYPLEILRFLHGIAEKDHILNDMNKREYLDCATGLADMKAGRYYTLVD